MKLLLTGGAGYLGRHLVNGLLALGFEPILLLHSPASLKQLPAGVCYRLFSPETLPELLKTEGFDVVVNLAAVYGRKGESYPDLLQANCLYPLQVLDAALAASVPLFFNAGTSLPALLSPYALSKQQFSNWGRLLCGSSGAATTFVNLKIEHFYGPGDSDEKFTTWVFQQLLNNVADIPLTSGQQKRDFIYIDDLVAAILCLLQNANQLPTGWVDVPVGSGDSISIRAFVELTRRIVGASTRLCFGAVDERPGEPLELRADISFLRELGWEPKYSLAEGITKCLTTERQGDRR